jgi:hypothetical protein
VLIKTTSCDAGVRVDLLCDSCDASFSPRASIPQIPAAVRAAATARGWLFVGPTAAGPHLCPACAGTQRGNRLAKAAAI